MRSRPLMNKWDSKRSAAKNRKVKVMVVRVDTPVVEQRHRDDVQRDNRDRIFNAAAADAAKDKE